MEVVNKVMYHFHDTKISKYNDVWVPGNEFIIDDNYTSYYSNMVRNFSLSVLTQGNKNSQLIGVIDYYLNHEPNQEIADKILKDSRRIIMNYCILTRENALEEARKKIDPSLPSRFHSIWLCDELGAKYWNHSLNTGNTYELYKVLLTGELFKSSDAFIPKNYKDYNECLEIAKKYWNPVFENEEQEEKAEYLFQGKIKVLEKIS